MDTTKRARPETRLALFGFLGLLGFALFLLAGPFFDAAPAYRPRPPGTHYAYSFLVIAAFVPYSLALRGRPGLRAALGGAAILWLVLLPAAIVQSQDAYAYLIYGKLWAVHGANPYVVVPQAFASDP